MTEKNINNILQKLQIEIPLYATFSPFTFGISTMERSRKSHHSAATYGLDINHPKYDLPALIVGKNVAC